MEKTGTKLRLMESAEKLLYQVSYDRLTIGKITRECGISRQAFYKYFANKEELIAQMSAHFIYTGFSMDQPFTWRMMVTHFLTEQQNHKQFYFATSHATEDRVAFRIFLEFVLKLYRSMAAYAGGAPLAPDADILLQIYCRGGIDYLVQWMGKGMRESVPTMVDYFERSMPPEVHTLLTSCVFPPELG